MKRTITLSLFMDSLETLQDVTLSPDCSLGNFLLCCGLTVICGWDLQCELSTGVTAEVSPWRERHRSTHSAENPCCSLNWGCQGCPKDGHGQQKGASENLDLFLILDCWKWKIFKSPWEFQSSYLTSHDSSISRRTSLPEKSQLSKPAWLLSREVEEESEENNGDT